MHWLATMLTFYTEMTSTYMLSSPQEAFYQHARLTVVLGQWQ